ncbi:MAG: F0F1 ATP synthase subunit A [Syntrophomonadaceae bacterium]|nr:F0F1 ATP synthase subunit A [Syntrophomonadaceae bacterium]
MHEVLFHIGPVPVFGLTFTSWVIVALLALLFYFGTRNIQRVPSGLQNVMEAIVEGLYNFFAGILGEKRARLYTPLLGTFFLFIILSNYSGLIPGSGMIHGFKAPTSDWNVTGALAIIVFFATHYYGIKSKGLGYFKHFLTPYAAFLPLNILEEFVRPLSLTVRLFGNIFAEETIIFVFLGMAPFLVPVPMMALSILLGAIQALVFTVLATSYIGAATEEHEEA